MKKTLIPSIIKNELQTLFVFTPIYIFFLYILFEKVRNNLLPGLIIVIIYYICFFILHNIIKLYLTKKYLYIDNTDNKNIILFYKYCHYIPIIDGFLAIIRWFLIPNMVFFSFNYLILKENQDNLLYITNLCNIPNALISFIIFYLTCEKDVDNIVNDKNINYNDPKRNKIFKLSNIIKFTYTVVVIFISFISYELFIIIICRIKNYAFNGEYFIIVTIMNLINMSIIVYYVINSFSRKFMNLEKKIAEKTKDLEIANKALKDMALSDSLTGLRNRRYISEFVVDYVNNFLKSKLLVLKNIMDKRNLSINNKVIGIIMLDIDHFKNINDLYGHKTGDTVLLLFAQKMKKLIRTDDIIIRWGGEEFMIILNKTIPEYMPVIAKKLLITFREEKIKLDDNNENVITCSIGSTIFPINDNCPDLISFNNCITYSDKALYNSKKNGRNMATHIELNHTLLAYHNIDDLKLNIEQNMLHLDNPIFTKTIIE